MTDALKTYRGKRDFSITPEPAGGDEAAGGQPSPLSFVIQKHWASRLHYDFRLELDGTMKSWAVPKGPSFDSKDKRMAVQVEDHPISYSSFEGTIPEKQYGAGKVIIWDNGDWQPLGDPRQGYEAGNLKFELHGHKMHGRWALIRMKGRGEKKAPWLLIKEKDEFMRPAAEFSVVDEMPDSVKALPRPKATPAPSSTSAPAPLRDVQPPKIALPEKLSPQLATLADGAPPDADEWLFEVKFDGYRVLARVDEKELRLLTRNGHDWTAKMPALHAALIKMQLPPGWYDGEIVVNDGQGRSDFGALQQAFDENKPGDIVYYLFDLPFFDGYDLRHAALESRRRLLQATLEQARQVHESPLVRFSAALDAQAADIMAAACKLGLEGIIGKRRASSYVSRRSADWIKLKCGQRQEFVIGGYTDPQGARSGIGALLIGVHDDDGRLRHAGKVGSGFDDNTLRDLRQRLEKLTVDDNPFEAGTRPPGKAHWVKPQLLAEVSFAGWTAGGAVRHGVFRGLRSDKPARRIVREVAQPVAPAKTKPAKTKPAKAKPAKQEPASSKTQAHLADVIGKLPATFKISNADRIIDADSGTTKIELVRYYALVSALMLVHLKGRPVSLVRAPAGVGGELFFQKHADIARLPGVRQLPQQLDPEHPAMLEIATVPGLLAAAQWNVVELHTQNALATAYDRPNRIVFDLDPGKGVAWETIQQGAVLLRAFLGELGLVSFLKTSGGKGLHVVVPVKPAYDWDNVKGFSQAVVAHMAATIPERFVLKSGAGNRVGKIFIDYLRNGRGATTVCAWSARSRSGLGMSVPLGWDELDGLKGGDQWTIHTVHQRLDVGNEPWSKYARSARGLAGPMKMLGFVPD